jgi:hypothetical protein
MHSIHMICIALHVNIKLSKTLKIYLYFIKNPNFRFYFDKDYF